MAARNDVVLTCGKKKKNDAVFVSTVTKRRRFAGLKKLKLKCPSCSSSGRIKKSKGGRRREEEEEGGREEEVPTPGEEEEEKTCGWRRWSCTISWSAARRLALGCKPERR